MYGRVDKEFRKKYKLSTVNLRTKFEYYLNELGVQNAVVLQWRTKHGIKTYMKIMNGPREGSIALLTGVALSSYWYQEDDATYYCEFDDRKTTFVIKNNAKFCEASETKYAYNKNNKMRTIQKKPEVIVDVLGREILPGATIVLSSMHGDSGHRIVKVLRITPKGTVYCKFPGADGREFHIARGSDEYLLIDEKTTKEIMLYLLKKA